MLINYNPNPEQRAVGDCAIRALTKALNLGWYEVYIKLALQGLIMGDMPNSNAVIGAFLRANGFVKRTPPNDCPDCYTVDDFCNEHPNGTFLIFVNNHILCAKDGCVFDTWDSTHEIPIYYFEKENKE